MAFNLKKNVNLENFTETIIEGYCDPEKRVTVEHNPFGAVIFQDNKEFIEVKLVAIGQVEVYFKGE